MASTRYLHLTLTTSPNELNSTAPNREYHKTTMQSADLTLDIATSVIPSFIILLNSPNKIFPTIYKSKQFSNFYVPFYKRKLQEIQKKQKVLDFNVKLH